jgi:hypothetical protein
MVDTATCKTCAQTIPASFLTGHGSHTCRHARTTTHTAHATQTHALAPKSTTGHARTRSLIQTRTHMYAHIAFKQSRRHSSALMPRCCPLTPSQLPDPRANTANERTPLARAPPPASRTPAHTPPPYGAMRWPSDRSRNTPSSALPKDTHTCESGWRARRLQHLALTCSMPRAGAETNEPSWRARRLQHLAHHRAQAYLRTSHRRALSFPRHTRY